MTALLEIDDLGVACGQADVVRGVFSRIEAVQLVTVSGPNGAGKPLAAAMGLLRSRQKHIAATYLEGHA